MRYGIIQCIHLVIAGLETLKCNLTALRIHKGVTRPHDHRHQVPRFLPAVLRVPAPRTKGRAQLQGHGTTRDRHADRGGPGAAERRRAVVRQACGRHGGLRQPPTPRLARGPGDRLLDVVRGHIVRGLRDGAPSREVTVDRLFFDGFCSRPLCGGT